VKVKGLPLAPPPPDLVGRAEEIAAGVEGLQVRFTPVIDQEASVLIWAVKVETDRGTMLGIPKGNTDQACIECLHHLGLLVE
jgi:hypothetical protein